MPIPDEKRQYLAEVGLDDERIAQIEADLDGKAKEAEGLEHKEADEEVSAAEAVVEPEPKTEPAEPEAPVVTAEALADAIIAAVEPFKKEVEALRGELAELQRDDEEKVKEVAELTPAASLADLVKVRYAQRAVGSDEAVVDGRTKLAKAGPEHATEDPTRYTGIPFVDAIIASGQQTQ